MNKTSKDKIIQELRNRIQGLRNEMNQLEKKQNLIQGEIDGLNLGIDLVSAVKEESVDVTPK